MVSAAKLRRAQESIEAARPYAAKMQEVLTSLAARVDASSHPLLETRVPRKVELVVFTSDRGLCGSFNANIIKKTETFIEEHLSDKEVSLSFQGRKGAEYFRRRGRVERKDYVTPRGGANYGTAMEISRDVTGIYVDGECDEVYLVFSMFKSALTQVPVVERLLPVVPEVEESEGIEETTEFLFEPSPDEILGELLPRYVTSQIYRAVLETAASEHGARMTAMDSASKNAKDMIHKLTIQYNRARQAAITTELMDIINGAEAL